MRKGRVILLGMPADDEWRLATSKTEPGGGASIQRRYSAIFTEEPMIQAEYNPHGTGLVSSSNMHKPPASPSTIIFCQVNDSIPGSFGRFESCRP